MVKVSILILPRLNIFDHFVHISDINHSALSYPHKRTLKYRGTQPLKKTELFLPKNEDVFSSANP